MGLILSETEKAGYEPISEGLHPAVCIAIIDIGLVYSEQFEKTQDKVLLQWEVIDETVTTEEKEQHRVISKEYTKSFFERSTLRKTLKSWRGREFTEEELKAFDLRKVLGVPCQLQITHTVKGDKRYANIDSIVSYPKGMPKPVPDTEPFAFDLDAEDWQQMFVKLPEWIQNKIKDSETYKQKVEERPFDEGVQASDDEAVPF